MSLNTYLPLPICFSRFKKVECKSEVPECYVLQIGSSPWKSVQSLESIELQR